jgi:lipoate-protein ligase B
VIQSTQWLSLTDYNLAWKLQQEAHQKVQTGRRGILLGCEHPAVITCGRRASPPAEMPLPVVQTNRGGFMTVHNPGQLVIYPIFSLRELGFGVRDWVDALLEVTAMSLKKCNIMFVVQNNGLYTQNGKIASIGINVTKGISLHGIAINVSNNLEDFNLISPCGMHGQRMDRVAGYDSRVSTEMLFWIWCDSFKNLTGSTIMTTNKSSYIGSLGAVGSAFP